MFIDSLKIIGKGGILFLPQNEEITESEILADCKKLKVECKVLGNISDLVASLLEKSAHACYEKAIVPLSTEVTQILEDYLKLENKNEQFKDYYMREVVHTFNRFQDLQQRNHNILLLLK